MHISWKLWLWWHNVKMAMTFKVGWDWVLLLDCFAKSVSRVFPLLANPSRRHSLFDWNVHLPAVGNSDSHFLRHGIFFENAMSQVTECRKMQHAITVARFSICLNLPSAESCFIFRMLLQLLSPLHRFGHKSTITLNHFHFLAFTCNTRATSFLFTFNLLAFLTQEHQYS